MHYTHLDPRVPKKSAFVTRDTTSPSWKLEQSEKKVRNLEYGFFLVGYDAGCVFAKSRITSFLSAGKVKWKLNNILEIL